MEQRFHGLFFKKKGLKSGDLAVLEFSFQASASEKWFGRANPFRRDYLD